MTMTTTTIGPPNDAKPGFQLLLQEIAARVVPGISMRAAVEDILTLGGRQDLAYGTQSLTAMQRAFMEHAHELELQDATNASAADASTWVLGQWTYGRIWLSSERPTDDECRVLGTVSVTREMHDAIVKRARSFDDEWQSCDAEMHAFFENLDAPALERVLFEVHEACDHTDPILYYIGDDTITNFGKYNNLQERGADLPECFHRRARVTPRERWSAAERIYVFCAYWLRMAGCRGEEFCGRQLNPFLLRAYLDVRLADFSAAAAPLTTIEERARMLARCKSEKAGELLTYRWVNGLTFYKEERLLARANVTAKHQVDGLPARLRKYVAEACGVNVAQHASLASLFDACVAQMATRKFLGNDGELNAVEAMLKVIVECAVEATGSDVGMSRGTRDMARMHRAFAEERYEEICGWQNTEYFCAVFPSEALAKKLDSKRDILVRILYACAARMQFNHWHYAPGHCPPGSVPADRHYYYPPRLPDIAIWSDQHHTGHVLAEVRYSIRSPAPLTFNGKVFPGMVDLRLFRQSGVPYTDEELMTALTFTEYVRLLNQSVSDHLARTAASGGGDAPVCITAFGKDWYRDYYGPKRDAPNASSSTTHATPAPVAAPVAAARSAPRTELFRMLCRHAASADAPPAFIEARQPNPDVPVPYRSLAAHAQALHDAIAVHAGGIKAGDVVAVLSQRPLHQAISIVAGIANGIIVNPLNPALASQMLAAQLEHAQPAWLIVDGSVAPPAGLAESIRCVQWNDVFANVATHEAQPLPAVDDAADAHADADAAASSGLLIYTSGTTGASKGVLLKWSHIAANVRYAIDALHFESGQVTGSLLPRFHTFTLINDVFPALFLRGTTVIADAFDISNVKHTVDAFVRHGVRSYAAVPIIFEMFCALNAWSNANALRMGVAGAAPLKEKTRVAYEKAFGHPIIPCYGLSETTCFAAISPRDAIRAGAVGKPAGIEIRVIDENGEPLGVDVTGELAMRGPSVISEGYFRDTQGRYAHVFSKDSEGRTWFKTGDVGRIDADGYVYVTGRKKNMVIRGGEKVYLEDVDRCLANLLGVLDAASVVLVEPGEPDQALTFIVTGGLPLPVDEIVAHVRASLSSHHVPDRIYFVERIPRTPTGKASHPEMLALSRAMRVSQSTQSTAAT